MSKLRSLHCIQAVLHTRMLLYYIVHPSVTLCKHTPASIMHVAVCPCSLISSLVSMTSVLAPMADDSPSVASVAEGAQSYYGCLSTKAALQIAPSLGLEMAGGDSLRWHGFRCQSSGAPRSLRRLAFCLWHLVANVTRASRLRCGNTSHRCPWYSKPFASCTAGGLSTS